MSRQQAAVACLDSRIHPIYGPIPHVILTDQSNKLNLGNPI